MATLLISSRFTDDNQALWRAAIDRGWTVERVRGIRVPEGLTGDKIVIYIESLFAPTIAEALDLSLIEPPIDWLVTLPNDYRRRHVWLATMAEARQLSGPVFVKPPKDKSFEARVYASGRELPVEVEDSAIVLAAEPVAFLVEYRCFVLERGIRAISPYLRHGGFSRTNEFACPEEELQEAREFAQRILADGSVDFPRAIVLDVGRIENRGWAVVELNAAWGSGIYGCDPTEVLEVVRCAVIPRSGGHAQH